MDELDLWDGIDTSDPDAVAMFLDNFFHCCELEADDEGVCTVCGHMIPTGSAWQDYHPVEPLPDTY